LLFFSSRRRHTRSDRDWSSDVCSSDLTVTGSFALVQVDGGLYSVWSTWAKLPVTVYVGVNEVAIVGPDPDVRVVHPRVGFGGKRSEERRAGKERRSEI